MKAEIGYDEAEVSRTLHLNTSTAPSLRVPVTSGNRALLRVLRAEELSAWEQGRAWQPSRLNEKHLLSETKRF